MRRLPLLLASTFLLGACTAGPVTTVNVTGPAQATVTVSAHFTDDAAQAVLSDQAILDDLVANVERITGSAPQVELSENEVWATSEVPVESLPSLSGITGVASVSATSELDVTTVVVEFTQARKLAKAVQEAVAGREDSQALEAVMLDSAEVSVVVTFPGEILSAEGAGLEVVREPNQVTASRPATAEEAATLTVTGRHTGGWNLPPVLWAGLGILVTVGLLAGLRAWTKGRGRTE